MAKRRPALWCAVLLLAWASAGASQTRPRRVLLLYSYDRDFAPHRSFARLFRPELERGSLDPVEFIEVSLQPARMIGSAAPDDEVQRIGAMLGGRQPDLVVPIGGPATMFAQRNRQELFPSTAMLFAAVDQRFVRDGAPANDTAVVVDHEPARLVDNILHVLPDTNTIFVVVGASRLEQVWLEEMKRVFQRFEGRVTFSYANELAFPEMVTRSAGLPPHSAILFAILSLDARGVPQVEDVALGELHAAANAPIFGLRTTQLGLGIVGGPLMSMEELSHTTTRVALRLLSGETPAHIRTATQRLGTPIFDERELHRWRIDEAHLPSGSTIRFREPTPWQRYRGPVFVSIVVGVPFIVILGLMAHRERRRGAALSGLSHRLMQAQEEERADVARMLRDDLCQRMVAITVQLNELEGAGAVQTLRRRLADMAVELFAISNQMSPSNLDLIGLAATSRVFCEELSRGHDVQIAFTSESVPANLPNPIALSVFRVMQEALANAIQATARDVAVSLRCRNGEVVLEVSGEGAGFDPLGLVAMRERLSQVDGTCAFESRPGGGTRVCAHVPLAH